MTNDRMSEYVTRGEMHEALAIWAGAIVDRVLQGLKPQFEAIDTKFEARFDEIHGRLVLMESRVSEIPELITSTKREILDSVQSMLDPQRTVPERLAQLEDARLPERVRKLEAKVHAPKRRASKSGRRRRS